MAKVTLVHPIIGEREFEKDHADRILTMQERTGKPNGGWTLKQTTTGNDADGATNKGKAKRGRKESSADQ